MKPPLLYKLLNYAFAIIWLLNGLYCKVLHGVPRHQQIVARILGDSHAALFTTLIGITEILMAIWIVSNYKRKLNVILQITVVACMNTIEFLLAPDLLLWGHFNAVFASLLIVVLYLSEFRLKEKI